MAKKLVTMEAPPDPASDAESTVFNDENLAHTITEIKAFVNECDLPQIAGYRVSALAHDLEQRLRLLHQNIWLRTVEGQENLSLDDLDQLLVALRNMERHLYEERHGAGEDVDAARADRRERAKKHGAARFEVVANSLDGTHAHRVRIPPDPDWITCECGACTFEILFAEFIDHSEGFIAECQECGRVLEIQKD